MRTRWLFWDEDEVRKKKTLVLVFAVLLILSLLGLYAATGPEGGLIAGATPTALTSPSAVATATPPIPTSTATPMASAVPIAKATATSVPLEPTLTPTVTPPIPNLTATTTPTASAMPVAKATATPVPPEPTVAPTATSVMLGVTPTPTVGTTAPLAAPIITTPTDGSVLKDDRPTIFGTAPPNTMVQVYDEGSLVGTGAADAQGNWALLPDEPLEPGEHTITAVANDGIGRTSAPSVAVTFTVIIERLPTAGGSWFERWLDRLLSIAFP